MQSLFRNVQYFAVVLVVAILGGNGSAPSQAGEPTIGEILNAVVEIHAEIRPDARSLGTLGDTRSGSGVLIGDGGLILTIGYIIMEAERIRVRPRGGPTMEADVVAYDHDTGFGLLRARQTIDAAPLELGSSKALDERARLLVVSVGDQRPVSPVQVVSRRAFAGSWEYLLERAIYTMPPHQEFGGAALVDQSGKLVGIGSLMVHDAPGPDIDGFGNMFVPVELLKPVLDSLVKTGRSEGSVGPWLGVYTREVEGQLLILRLAAGGPGEVAGLHPGEVILGVGGKKITGMTDFFRKVRAQGDAGAEVSLDVLTLKSADMSVRKVAVKSRDRHSWLRLKE
ncbi:MAG: serine protease [Rhodospirillaceae bacterium]|jgi:S1-C subfamily serine protease|nr:serine protease [Rhodospirillaceae bacterium]